MKRLFPVIALLVSLLCACGQVGGETAAVYDVTQNGVVYTVDREACTITRGEQVYRYEEQYGADGSTLTITYPNGATYTRTSHSESGAASVSSMSWNTIYEQDHDVPGETLLAVLDQGPPTQGASQPSCFNPVGLLPMAVGLWALASPKSVWYLSYGWWFKNAEPSDAALVVERIAGGLFIVVGLFILFS